MTYPDGAFTVGGGEWNYGQTMTEDLGKSMFMLPAPTPDNILTILRLALERLPLDALKLFQPLMGLAEELFNNVGGAVGAIIEALITRPLNFTMELLVQLLQTLFPWVPWASIPEKIEDVFEWVIDSLHAIPFFGDFLMGAETFVEAFIRNIVYYLTNPGEILTAFVQALKDLFAHGGELINTVITSILYWLTHPGELLTGLIDWLKDIFGHAGELFQHVIEGFIYWITHPGSPGGIGYLLIEALKGLFTNAGLLVQTIIDAVVGWLKTVGIDLTGPLSFMQLVVDNVARFFGQTGETLFRWANSLVNLDNLGQLIQGLFGSIFSIFPISMINTQEKVNLLNMGVFQTASSLQGAGGWGWDSSRNRTGTIGGSAKLDVGGSSGTRTLYSNQNIRVAAGDRIAVSAFLYTVGFNGPAGSIQLVAIPFAGTSQQADVLLASRGASNSAWNELTNQSAPWEITAASGITSIQLALRVTSSASAGGVWWDDLTLWKTGLMKQGLVEYLISAWNGLIGGLGVTSGGTATPAGTVDPWNFTLQAGANAKSTANSANANAAAAQTTANSANTNASNAYSTASTANSTASTANSTANTAWYAANGAQSSANTAQTSANTAQSTANTANSAASSATSVANTASSNASTALGAANGVNSRLYGTTAPGGGAKVQPTALPLTTILPTSGSGAQISRRNTVNVNASPGRIVFPTGFFDYQDQYSTNITTTLSEGKFTVTEAGWYMVELSFRLNPAISFGFCVAPLLFKGTASSQAAYKIGDDAIMGTWGYGSTGNRYAHSSWIVYLNAGEAVRAGFDAVGTAVDLFDADASGIETYFSISMMNKSFA